MQTLTPSPLGVAVFGVSTPFAYWGFRLVRNIVEAATGATLHLHVASRQQLQDRFDERGGGSVVITSDYPDDELMEFLLSSSPPLIVFADSTHEFVDWAAHSRQLSVERAVRLCSDVICSLAPAFRSPRALTLDPQSRVRPMVSGIVAHLFPDADERLGSSIYETLTASGRLSPAGFEGWRHGEGPPATAPETADAISIAQIKSALASYAPVLAGRTPDEIVWPSALFICPGAANGRGPIDLIGPARILMYGPYMHLPAGEWVARVEFEIDGAKSGVEAAADVFISEVLYEKAFLMPEKGIFAFELAFRVRDPRRPVEIRLSIKRSAIEGVLLVRSVVVRPA